MEKKEMQQKASAVNKKALNDITDNLKIIISKYGVLIVAVISFFINIAVLSDYYKSPFSKFLLWDSANYWRWAQEIAGGNWLGNSIFYQSPLYPYLLSVFVSVFGKTLLPLYLFQCIISAATSAAVYSLCTKITKNSMAGLIAGVLYSFYGLQVFYSTRILSECIAAFLIVLTARLLISGRFFNVTILSGFFMGLLLLVKPHFLMAVPFILLFYKIVFKQNGISVFLKKTIFFLLPLMIVVSVVAIRNYYVGKEFVLISSNGGEIFYTGNNDRAIGTYMLVDGISRNITFQNADAIALAQSNSGKKLTHSGVSKYWFNKGISFITSAPLKYAALEWAKFKNIFSGAELSNMYSMKFEKNNITRLFSIPFVNFYLLFPLMCAGFVTAVRQWKKYYILLLMLFVNWLNIMIFFYDTRFMVITMPIVAILSGVGLWNILKQISSYRLSAGLFLQPSSLALLLGTCMVFLIMYRDSKFPSQDWRFFMVLGEIYYGMDDVDKSIDNFIKSFELNQSDYRSSIGACKALMKKGSVKMAAELYTLTLNAIGEEDKKMLLEDTDFNLLRAYVNSK